MTATTEVTYRVIAKDADEAAAKAVDEAGREGHDIYDVPSARRAPKGGRGYHAYEAGEFVFRPEFIVKIRVFA